MLLKNTAGARTSLWLVCAFVCLADLTGLAQGAQTPVTSDPIAASGEAKQPDAWGRYRPYVLAGALVVIAQGALITALLIQRTRRARVERALRESEEKFRLIADLAPVMMWSARPDTTLDYLNSTCVEFTGLPLDQLLDNGWLNAVHPDDVEHCARTYVPAIEARRPFRMEYRIRAADGAYRWVLDLGVPKHGPDGSFSGFLGTTVDITERKASEDALRESQQRLTMATAAGAVGIWDWNFETNQLFVDPGLKALLGFTDAEISTHPEDWGARVHPEDVPAAAALVKACVDGDADVYEIEHRMLHKDGSVRWFLSRGTAVRGEDRTLRRLVGTKVDVTERKRATEQFRLAIEAAPAGMLMVDSTGAIVLVNAKVETLFGYDRAELIGRPAGMLLPVLAFDLHAEHRGFHYGPGPLRMDGSGDFSGVRKDGTEVPVEIGVNALDTSEGELVLVSVVDIAERKRVERVNQDLMEQLQHLAGSLITAQDAERARLARDLHDDVSQQLAGLCIELSGLRRRVGMAQDGELQAGVSSLQQRAVNLAESVRALSHDLHPNVLQHAGLTAALSDYCAGLSRSQAIAVTCTAEGDVASIDADSALCLYRIAQEALHNVVKHAGARRAEVRLLRTSDIAQLTVGDDGKGFDVAETRRSRKGLGLVSINERVRLSGGTLSVVTEKDKGTQIRVRLPASRRPSADAGDVSGRFAAT